MHLSSVGSKIVELQDAGNYNEISLLRESVAARSPAEAAAPSAGLPDEHTVEAENAEGQHAREQVRTCAEWRRGSLRAPFLAPWCRPSLATVIVSRYSARSWRA